MNECIPQPDTVMYKLLVSYKRHQLAPVHYQCRGVADYSAASPRHAYSGLVISADANTILTASPG